MCSRPGGDEDVLPGERHDHGHHGHGSGLGDIEADKASVLLQKKKTRDTGTMLLNSREPKQLWLGRGKGQNAILGLKSPKSRKALPSTCLFDRLGKLRRRKNRPSKVPFSSPGHRRLGVASQEGFGEEAKTMSPKLGCLFESLKLELGDQVKGVSLSRPVALFW